MSRPLRFDEPFEKITISLPKMTLTYIDDMCSKMGGMTRSAYLRTCIDRQNNDLIARMAKLDEILTTIPAR